MTKMTTDQIKAEHKKRFNGAKSNRCILGCGKRTSDKAGHHYSCYLSWVEQGRSDELSAIANLYGDALIEWDRENRRDS